MKKRAVYAALVLGIIALGLLSRKISVVPLWVGDVLYAVMVYFIIRCIWLSKSSLLVALWSLTICCSIELSQLYQAPWINEIRETLPGRLILGRGFLCSDLLAYVGGVLAAFLLEKGALGARYRK